MTISMTRNAAKRIKVWDIGVRLFYWTMMASVASAYFLAEQRVLHRRLGYVVIALIGFRLIWGLIGVAAGTVTTDATIATVTVLAIAIIAVALVRVMT